MSVENANKQIVNKGDENMGNREKAEKISNELKKYEIEINPDDIVTNYAETITNVINGLRENKKIVEPKRKKIIEDYVVNSSLENLVLKDFFKDLEIAIKKYPGPNMMHYN